MSATVSSRLCWTSFRLLSRVIQNKCLGISRRIYVRGTRGNTTGGSSIRVREGFVHFLRFFGHIFQPFFLSFFSSTARWGLPIFSMDSCAFFVVRDHDIPPSASSCRILCDPRCCLHSRWT